MSWTTHGRRTVRTLAGGAVWLLATGCAEPPPARTASESGALEEDENPPESSEWLFATGRGSGSAKLECGAVLEKLGSEDGCKGRSCIHGARLARDWLGRCSDQVEHDVTRVRTLEQVLSQRAEVTPSRCSDDVEQLLREGCGDRADCGAWAQAWATRCGSGEATPLIVLMLEQTIAQTTGVRLGIDPRSCDELAAKLLDAGRCRQRFDCEDALPKLELFDSRCRKNGVRPRPPIEGLAVLALQQGAGASRQAIAVAGRVPPEALATARLGAALVPGPGAVLRVCNARVLDLESYLAARQTCSGGEVTVARLKAEGNDSFAWQLGVLGHADETSFTRRYPGLVAAGEREARERNRADLFARQLDQIAAQAPANPVGARQNLVATLIADARWVRESGAFQQALASHDGGLVPLFVDLAAAKAAAVRQGLRGRQLLPYARRCEELALADVDEQGQVGVGAFSLASTLDLLALLPKSATAYREGLGALLKRAGQTPVHKRDLKPLAVELGQQAARCGKAGQQASQSQATLLECAFEAEGCDDTRRAELDEQLLDAQGRSQEAYGRAVLAMASLGEEDRDAAGSVLEESGCTPPWW